MFWTERTVYFRAVEDPLTEFVVNASKKPKYEGATAYGQLATGTIKISRPFPFGRWNLAHLEIKPKGLNQELRRSIASMARIQAEFGIYDRH